MTELVPHEWDAYGKPTTRDVDAPLEDVKFECDHLPAHDQHGPKHDWTTIDEHITELREELERYESDARHAQYELDDAEAGAEETRQLIADAEEAKKRIESGVIPAPPQPKGATTWLP